MDTLEVIRIVAEIILFASLIVLALFSTVHVVKISNSIKKTETDIMEISNKITGLSYDISGTIDDVKKISTAANIEISKIRGFTDNAIETGNEILLHTKNVSENVIYYLRDALNLISAVKYGVKVFKSKF